ncbi:hypothetical protein ID866_2096 [Astraeus odoratus]|nr:hypothetical protein ID866_2096 [Astraeus odoratus]
MRMSEYAMNEELPDPANGDPGSENAGATPKDDMVCSFVGENGDLD